MVLLANIDGQPGLEIIAHNPASSQVFAIDRMGTAVPGFPILVDTSNAAIHVVLVNVKARNEERHLLVSHGGVYARYIERTGRFVPRFGAHDS